MPYVRNKFPEKTCQRVGTHAKSQNLWAKPPPTFPRKDCYMGCKHERLVHFLPRYEYCLTFSCLVGETAAWEPIKLHWSVMVPLRSATRGSEGHGCRAHHVHGTHFELRVIWRSSWSSADPVSDAGSWGQTEVSEMNSMELRLQSPAGLDICKKRSGTSWQCQL